jgi:hypothetical protein
MHGGHQQRSRNSFSADVADGQHHPVGAEGNKVVVVAADRARRNANPVHFERGQVHPLVREEQLLHLVGDAELVLQPLLLFLLVNQFGQTIRSWS